MTALTNNQLQAGLNISDKAQQVMAHHLFQPNLTVGQAAQTPVRQLRKGWHVDIEQLEDGYVVTVGLLDVYNTKPRQYVATSIDEALQKIAVGVVTEKLET